MSKNEVDISIAAMAKRGGVSTAAFYNHEWHKMTLEERIADSHDWSKRLQRQIEKLELLRSTLIVSSIAMQQAAQEPPTSWEIPADSDAEAYEL